MSEQYSLLWVDVIANAGAVNLLILTVRVFQADQMIIGKDSAEIQAKSQQIIQKNNHWFDTILIEYIIIFRLIFIANIFDL